MWCVRLHDDGRFRAATRGNELVLSLEQWHQIDPAAAAQFDPTVTVQRRFMQATGLDRRAELISTLAAYAGELSCNPAQLATAKTRTIRSC